MEWFESWFDSKYYHILYKNRDDNEAEFFIKNLVQYLNLSGNEKVLDLACGKGRHAAILAQNNLITTGVDLSENSINEAKKLEKENLRFFTHDMRQPLNEKFDIVFNLFTSFGYFNDKSDNIRVLKSIEKMLKNGGTAIIDFMNAKKVLKHLVKQEQKNIEGIKFHIERSIENGIIIKTINFEDNGNNYCFEERVQALNLNDFKQFSSETSLKLKSVFGNYDLSDFNEDTSDRLILELIKE